jgi:alkanesulfonate monooxygenase SsuD/methylene tetrahydromethanopterin reductase-like flavin-dependent oxidoreductase (luciferase family)
MVAAMDTLRRGWRGELVPGGPHQDLAAVPIRPLPARPGGPPLWIGAMSERAVKRAGRIADGFMATEVSPAMVAEQAELAKAEFAASGRAGSLTISVNLPVFAWDGDEAGAARDGWDLVRDSIQYTTWKYDDMESAHGRSGAPQPAPPMTRAEEDALRESVILGTPRQVAERINEYRVAAGGDMDFVARLYFPGLGWDIQQRALRIFAEQVAPLARELAAGGSGG